LLPEAAADVAADHPDLAFRDAGQHGEHRPHEVRRLAGEVHGQVAGRLAEGGDAAAGLQRAGMHARIEDFLAHGDRGAGEGRVAAALSPASQVKMWLGWVRGPWPTSFFSAMSSRITGASGAMAFFGSTMAGNSS
jgi:hypothetical protein